MIAMYNRIGVNYDQYCLGKLELISSLKYIRKTWNFKDIEKYFWIIILIITNFPQNTIMGSSVMTERCNSELMTECEPVTSDSAKRPNLITSQHWNYIYATLEDKMVIFYT